MKLAQRVLFACAFALLGYCGYALLDTWIFQGQESLAFERLSDPRSQMANASLPSVTGGLLGRIEVARLGLSVILMEGTSKATLQRAVGHIAGTAQPGHAGNVGIAGHRDTFFYPLRNIHRDDIITLTTLDGKFAYRVVSTQVANPNTVSVLAAGSGQSVTLVTCFPFYFVGPAPNRFIVRAERLL